MKQDPQANGNVVKFRKRKPQKTPRPGLRKFLTAMCVVMALVAVWAYFASVGKPL
ncbi:hypothetical protein [Rhizobium sp. Root1203]|jgi:hypothetical protein|uniref:hypothetical protein n=1 Tax=Rhizobium sp. Root1203 TaxID=1736427 RepID=UPI000A6F5F9D|nr:hypothetical protein [Rhizobium sp. Root1203]